MDGLNGKQWCIVIGITVGIAILTWTTLNLARVLYQDWAFLHAVRLINEQQLQQGRGSAPPPAPAPGAGK